MDDRRLLKVVYDILLDHYCNLFVNDDTVLGDTSRSFVFPAETRFSGKIPQIKRLLSMWDVLQQCVQSAEYRVHAVWIWKCHMFTPHIVVCTGNTYDEHSCCHVTVVCSRDVVTSACGRKFTNCVQVKGDVQVLNLWWTCRTTRRRRKRALCIIITGRRSWAVTSQTPLTLFCIYNSLTKVGVLHTIRIHPTSCCPSEKLRALLCLDKLMISSGGLWDCYQSINLSNSGYENGSL